MQNAKTLAGVQTLLTAERKGGTECNPAGTSTIDNIDIVKMRHTRLKGAEGPSLKHNK